MQANSPHGEKKAVIVRWRRAVFIVFFVLGGCHISFISRYPSIRIDLGLSVSEMTWLISSLALGSFFGLMFAGQLLKRFPTVSVMRTSVIIAGLAFAGSVFVLYSPAPWAAMLTLPVYSFVFSTADVAATVSGIELEHFSKRPQMSFVYSAFSIGALLGVLGSALATAVKLSVPFHLIFLIVFGFALGAWVLQWIPEPSSVDRLRTQPITIPSDEHSHKRLLTPRIFILALIGASAALAESTANNWLPLALIDVHGVPTSTGVLALAVTMSCTILLRLLGNRFIQRFGRAAVLASTLFIGSIGILLVIVAPALPIAFIGIALWGAGIGLAGPIVFSAAGDDRELAGQRVARVSIVSYMGFLIGPALIGFVSDSVSFQAAFAIAASMLLVSSLLSGSASQSRYS